MINFVQYLVENILHFNSPEEAFKYAKEQDKRIPEIEKYLLQSKDELWCYSYAAYVIKGRWIEAESIILDSRNAWTCYCYAYSSIGSRWPEAEEIICTDINILRHYCRHFNLSLVDVQKELIKRNPAIIGKIDELHPDLEIKYKHLLDLYNSGITK